MPDRGLEMGDISQRIDDIIAARRQRLAVVVRALHRDVVTAGDAANPLAFTGHLKMDEAVVERTAAALLVLHLDLEEHHVGTIGFRSLGVVDGGQVELIGFAGGLCFVTAAIVPHRFQRSGFESYLVESE